MRPEEPGADDPVVVAQDIGGDGDGGGDVGAGGDGGVRLLWLNRPARRNAIDMELRVLLAELLEAAQADPGVRAVVLAGAGGSFCSGGDIATMTRLEPQEARARAQAAQRVVRALWTGPTPVVAAVRGAAYGAGLSLATACDLVVAAQDARFSTAFMGVGLAGDMGVFASLPARVGRQGARSLMLAPRVLTGEQAARVGIADEAVPEGAVLARALELAQGLTALPPLAVAETRAMLARGDADRLDVLAAEVDTQVRLFGTRDFGEGVAAFLGKRPARFAGR